MDLVLVVVVVVLVALVVVLAALVLAALLSTFFHDWILRRDAMLARYMQWPVSEILSVSLSVCLSQARLLSKRLKVRESSFLMPKISTKFQWSRPNRGAVYMIQCNTLGYIYVCSKADGGPA